MGLLNITSFILNHPLNKGHRVAALGRFFKWQIGSRLVPGPVAIDFVNHSRLLMKKGLTGATGNLYVGLHEFQDMAFLLHLLRPDDLFIDVGANIGSYTILAGAAIGAKCLSYEPIPETFQWLMDNINLNGIYDRTEAKNIGIGRERGFLNFTGDKDTVNHVIAFEEKTSLGKSISVAVETLDDNIGNRQPVLIKIDVEGFETEVIAGAKQTLSKESLLGVIMELNGSGQRYGYNEEKLHFAMLDYGFRPFQYLPFNRSLVPLTDKNKTLGNTLYLRKVEEVKNRLKQAVSFVVHGHSI